jgi:hypothetical protein
MDYWKATRSRPDACNDLAERDFPICVELRKAQTK